MISWKVSTKIRNFFSDMLSAFERVVEDVFVCWKDNILKLYGFEGKTISACKIIKKTPHVSSLRLMPYAMC